MLNTNKKYGLALEGGGFRGSYQAGAIIGLHENGIEFKMVAGTSVGSLNGTFVVSDRYDMLKEIWVNFQVKDVFEVQSEELEKAIRLDFENMDFVELGKGIINTAVQGGLEVEPLLDLLKRSVDEDLVRNSDIPFGLVTFNVTDFKGEELMIDEIPVGELHNFLLASSYLPAFKQRKICGKHYLDGGVFNNLPSDLLAKNGCDDIIEIRLNNITRRLKPDRKVNIHKIEAGHNLGGIILYDKDVILSNFKKGYEDAKKLIMSEEWITE